jgi:hypothetical protein
MSHEEMSINLRSLVDALGVNIRCQGAHILTDTRQFKTGIWNLGPPTS